MSAFLQDIIRLGFDVESKALTVDAFTNESPEMWRNNDVAFQLGFFRDGQPLDATQYSSVKLIVKELDNRTAAAALMSRSVGASEITPLFTLEEWEEKTKQHCSIAFTAAETRLDLRGVERDFWLAVSVLTNAGNRITVGRTTLKMIHDGDDESSSLPPLGSTIVPNGATYNGSGEYVLNGLTANRWYAYAIGANDTKVVNGGQELSASGNFQANGTFVTLVGTPSAVITATVRTPVFLTLDELDARFQKKIAPWAVSENGLYVRLVGVDNNGLPYDEVKLVSDL